MTGQQDDINCEFSQMAINIRDLDTWLKFLERLTTKNLADLRIGTDREFKLTDGAGEKLKLVIGDSMLNQGYTIKVDFVRGRTSFSFEMETDITCLTNYYDSVMNLTK